ncbi:contact-dependent growth inhibition system immunity protein [Streptomyces canus]|uniref:contact-dependent growth inhibition system immunity protein n=1 Tax=Streptomyces canus TaxID=58343 RepID=UPI00370F8D9D
MLRDNPMAEGDMYEGALLSAALTRNPAVWATPSGLGPGPDDGAKLRAVPADFPRETVCGAGVVSYARTGSAAGSVRAKAASPQRP